MLRGPLVVLSDHLLSGDSMKSTHVVLTGPRAVGKSTIGRALAKRLGMTFIDLDVKVLARFPESTVGAVWTTHGESAWREMETTVLADLLNDPPMVLALGGGVPTIFEAAESLNRSRQEGAAMIIWLQADPHELASRLESFSDDRPSLTGRTPAEEIIEICRIKSIELRGGFRCVPGCGHDGGVAGGGLGPGSDHATAAIELKMVDLQLR